MSSSHPAGPHDSAFLASRRRMLRMGTAVVAAGQVLLLGWALVDRGPSSRGAAIGAGLALAATAALAALPAARTHAAGLLAWMLALSGALAVVAEATGPFSTAAVATAVPAALVGAVVLSPWSFVLVAGAHQVALLVPVLSQARPSWPGLGFRAAAYAVACLLAAGISLEQRRLLRARSGQALEARARAREVDHLLSVAHTLSQAHDEERVVEQVLELVCRFIGATGGALARWDPASGSLEALVPAWGKVDPPAACSATAVGVWRSGEPALEPRSLLVPLEFEGRRLGVMLAVRAQGPELSGADLNRLLALAGQAAVVLDQTRRYAVERDANERLVELSQLKSDFVATVSHELRTPLTTILGALKTLTRPELVHPDARARRLVAGAERQAERLRWMIEDLLTVSRIEAGGMPVVIQEVDLAELAREVVDEVVGPSPLHSGRVMAAPGLARFECDREHLRRVLVNLADNAVKYSGRGEVTVDVSTTTRGVRIVVADEGDGIPPGDQGALFQRFRRLQPAAARGTGLGLHIVHSMVTAMGGWVTCCSDVGFGTRFGILLPRHLPVAGRSEPVLAAHTS